MLINESILYPFDGRYFVVLNKQLKNGNKIEYEYDQKHGRGTYLWVNGDKYDGEWKNDNRHGRGTYTRANGYQHVGEWKNDKRYR